MKLFLIRRWFLILLTLCLAVGMSCSRPLTPLVHIPGLRQGIVVVVLFFMAFPLRATAMWQTLQQPLGPLLACGINYGLLPLTAWLMTAAMSRWWGLGTDMYHGTLIAAVTPCTLASAAVWTRRAGGNEAIAILVMIVTNLVCFVFTPLWLNAMIGRMPNAEGWAHDMVWNLGLLVVLPMAVAQLLRRIGDLGAWATEHKTPMGIAAQCGILWMIFLGAIQTGNKYAAGSQVALVREIVLMVIAVLSVHTAMLFTGIWLSRRVGLSRQDGIAVGFAGSQKTATVGLEVAAQLGITMLPMVAYHIGQLLIDTVIADRFRNASIAIREAAEPRDPTVN